MANPKFSYTVTKNGDGTLHLNVAYSNVGESSVDYDVLQSLQRIKTPSLIDGDVLQLYHDLLLQYGLELNESDISALNSRSYDTASVEASVAQTLTDLEFTAPEW